MWNLVAAKLRILVNVMTLLVDGLPKSVATFVLPVSASVRSFIYVSPCFSIYLDIYDMWGTIKFLVP